MIQRVDICRRAIPLIKEGQLKGTLVWVGLKKPSWDESAKPMIAISGVWGTIFGAVSYKGASLIEGAMIATMVTIVIVLLTNNLKSGLRTGGNAS